MILDGVLEMDSNDPDARCRHVGGVSVDLRRVLALGLVALLLGSVASAPASAAATNHDDETSPSFVVEVLENGDATITVTMTYDLETDDQRDAFRSLEERPDDQQAALDRFADRLSDVADRTAERTDRSMDVSAADVSVTQSDDVGALHLTVTWSGLAATEDDRLVVEEPFASGFETERPLTLVAPEGYEVASATPSPDDEFDAHATWDVGTSLENFEVVFEPTADDDDDGMPGFGVGVALLALVAALGVAVRRGSQRLE